MSKEIKIKGFILLLVGVVILAGFTFPSGARVVEEAEARDLKKRDNGGGGGVTLPEDCPDISVRVGTMNFITFEPLPIISPEEIGSIVQSEAESLRSEIDTKNAELQQILEEREQIIRQLEEAGVKRSSLQQELRSIDSQISQLNLSIKANRLILERLELEIEFYEGVSPLDAVIEVDARDHLRCVINDYYIPLVNEYKNSSFSSVTLSQDYLVSTGDGSTFIFSPWLPFFMWVPINDPTELENYIQWRGLQYVSHSYSPGENMSYINGQIDIQATVTNMGTLPWSSWSRDLSSASADAWLTIKEPTASVDLKADGMNGPISKVTGQSAILTWTSENVEEGCSSYQSGDKEATNWPELVSQDIQKLVPGVSVTFPEAGTYKLGLSCNPTDEVQINVTEPAVEPATLNVKSIPITGIPITNASGDPGFDPAAGTTDYNFGSDKAINSILEAPLNSNGYIFSSWSNCNGNMSADRTCHVTVAKGVTKTVTASYFSPDPAQCSDGLDNDDDGLIDYPADIGCNGPNDDDETFRFLRRQFREL